MNEDWLREVYNFEGGVRPFGRSPWDGPASSVGQQDLASFDVGERTEANGQPPAPDYSGITRDLCL